MDLKLIKIIGAAAVCCCVASHSAFARMELSTFLEQDGTVMLNLKSDEGDGCYAVIVTEPGQTIDSITENAPLKVLPIRFKGEKGVATVQGTDLEAMPKEGMYSVYVGGGNEEKNKVLNFCVMSGSSAALTALNAETTAERLANVLTNTDYNNRAWCIDNAAAAKSSVREAFAGLKKERYNNSFSSVNDVQSCFNAAIALAEFTETYEYTLAELVSWYKNEMGIALTAENGLGYIASGNKDIELAFDSLRKDKTANPVTNVNELERILKRSEALGMINGATRANIENIWKAYGKTLGIISDDGSYVNPSFDSVSSYELAKLVVREGSKAKFTSISEVKKTFDDAVDSLNNKKNGDSGKSGGSGGGSGSVGGAVIGGGMSVKNPGVSAGTQGTGLVSGVFKDLPIEHWACRQMEYAAKAGIIKGDGDGNCRPEAKVTRAEFVQMIANAFEIERAATASPKLDILYDNGTTPKPESQKFSDVSDDMWFSKAVDIGTRAGIISGYDDGRFGAYDNITRQDAATVLMRVKEACSVAISNSVTPEEFTDKEEIASYAEKAVSELQKYGVVNGYEDGTFRPIGELTRAEAVTLIYDVRRLANSL